MHRYGIFMKLRLCSALLIMLFVVRPVYSVQDAEPVKQDAADLHREPTALVAVVPEDAPPAYFRDRKTGNASGFAIDAMNGVAERAGMRVTYIFGRSWTEIIKKVESGEADVAPCMGITGEREKKLAFTRPLDTFPISLFVRSSYKTIAGPKSGMKVGVLVGSTAHEYLKNYPGIVLEGYDSYKTGLFDLLAGHIDAFCCLAPILPALAREAGMEDRITIAGGPLTEVKRAIAVRKSSALLRERLNRAVEAFVESPEYREIYLRWYGKRAPYWTLGMAVMVMAIGTLLVIVFMAVWRYRSIVKLDRIIQERAAELEKVNDQLRSFSAHLQKTREDERTMIAREVHDDLGQLLTALKIDLSMLKKRLPPDHDPLAEKTASMDAHIDEAIQSVKRISTDLRPGILDHLGLIAAIRWYAGEFEQRTGIVCVVAFEPEEIVLDKERTTTVFRVFQEMLTNVARHAQATEITALLRTQADGLLLQVKDNGRGITETEILQSDLARAHRDTGAGVSLERYDDDRRGQRGGDHGHHSGPCGLQFWSSPGDRVLGVDGWTNGRTDDLAVRA